MNTLPQATRVTAFLITLAALALPACSKPAPPADPRDVEADAAAKAEEEERAELDRQRLSAANLKKINRAVAEYAIESGHLLPAAVCDRKTGRPLLSWRVALLPHVGEEALYKRFDLGEPWDGPNNKKLLEKMPDFYATPGGERGTVTHYRGFMAAPDSKARTAWANLPAKEAPLGFWGGTFPDSFSDGTSNTFCVVEAAGAVPWTRPGEMDYGPQEPLPKLGLSKYGFLAGLADGAVLFFDAEIAEADLRKYVTSNGGEPVERLGLREKELLRFPGRKRGAKPEARPPDSRPADPKEDKAVSELRNLGAWVELDEKAEGNPAVWVRWKDTTPATEARMAHLAALPRLRGLVLQNTPVESAGLAHVKGLTALTSLNLGASQVTDAGLDHLKGMTGLRELYLAWTPVTDAGLAHLKGLTRLEVLDLTRTQVTDAGMAHLAGMTALRTLELHNAKVTDAGAAHLKRMQKLQKLEMDDTSVGDGGLAHLRGLTQMQELGLGSTQVTDAGLEHLRGMTELQKLGLSNTKVTRAGIAKLQMALPKVKISQ